VGTRITVRDLDGFLARRIAPHVEGTLSVRHVTYQGYCVQVEDGPGFSTLSPILPASQLLDWLDAVAMGICAGKSGRLVR
jgi:hypothetical protein